MIQAPMRELGEVAGVRWYWAEPGHFEKPGVYYWDGEQNVHVAAPSQPTTAQPAQEPVAHILPSNLERLATMETSAVVFSLPHGNPEEHSVPLYASPQPAQPQALTDAEIDAVVTTEMMSAARWPSTAAVTAIARAIESAILEKVKQEERLRLADALSSPERWMKLTDDECDRAAAILRTLPAQPAVQGDAERGAAQQGDALAGTGLVEGQKPNEKESSGEGAPT